MATLPTNEEAALKAQNEQLEELIARQADQLQQQQIDIELLQEKLTGLQEQLLQREKMASLGELTAGIAHEIQNPLNFVNNFGEVSAELVDELREFTVPNLPEGDQEETNAILDDLATNLEKIVFHGKRADSIVKSMLQHSRTNVTQKEPVDLNDLADEYLRLAYHGLRAKDKAFNAQLVTDFDPAVGKVTVFGQDIGRVLLNLYTNAFYATQQKQKRIGNPDQYRPTVWVHTKRNGPAEIEICIRDNGTGIPNEVIDKIFQPFFTTKPTGQGTGLGLSLSYEIISKGHGGTLSVETEDNSFTQFIIRLPV